MADGICLLGAGEHARVVAEAAALAGISCIGTWAREPGPGLPYLGDDGRLVAEIGRWRHHGFHLALTGGPRGELRLRILDRFASLELAWTTIVHPSAWVSPSAHLGVGAFVGPRAIIHAGARIGDHAIINSAVLVEHDVIVGTGAHLAPGAITGGGTRIGAWAFCGLGSMIRDHATVGDGAVVGMGAVVIADVVPGTLVVGNPARVRPA